MSTSDLTALVVGKGGREHALAWKLSQSPAVQHVYVVPGNGGTASLPNVSNVTDVKADDFPGLVARSKELGVGLVVVGPDDAVVAGIEEHFRDSGIPCFAPSAGAAEVEGSKAFSKDFMKRHGIPTAAYQTFKDYDAAKQYLTETSCDKVVIKVDGLAAGKGVILPESEAEAQQALVDIMVDSKFGAAGESVVIEELMEGDEFSVLTLSDGNTHISFPPGQDHKRILEGNKGLNTGGMGVYAPLPFISDAQMEEVDRVILQPTFDGLKSEGRTFKGLLFTGIMITSQGPKVIEYNARFGDPETQSMLMLLAPECDFAKILLACCSGTLGSVSMPLRPGFACNVIVAAGGYPGKYPSGDVIELKPLPKGVEVFHAGTEKTSSGELKTAGGRVLSIAAYGNTLEEAVNLAYEGVKSVHFKGMVYRKDIAFRAL